MASITKNEAAYGFLEGGGEMSAVIAAFDWSRTPLGPIAGWPHTLKAVTSLILRSPVPLVTLWGPLGIMLYNDAYSVFAGRRHPQLLGSEVRKGWPEVADWNDNVMKVGLAGGTLSYRDQLLVLSRQGTPEDVWLDLDYSPITDETGAPVGVIAIVVEITEKKRVMQRAAALAELGEAIRQNEDPEELAYVAAGLLGRALAASRAGYGAIDAASDTVNLTRNFISPGTRNLTGVIAMREFGSFVEDLKRGETVVISDVRSDPRTADHADRLEGVHARALVNVPVMEQGAVVAMLYVNSASPRRWDEDDIAFMREVAERIRTAIERRRAERSVRDNAARLTFLDALALETARSTDADAILAVTTRMLGEYLGASICAYADMEADEDHFTIRGDWCAPGSASIVGQYSLKDFGSVAVERLAAGKPLVINDGRAELSPQDAAAFQSIGVSATICMPLVKEGRLTALMALHHRDPHAWTEQEQALLAEVVERSWAHIERVRDVAMLRISESQFRTMAQAMPNHVWTATPDGLLDWLNDQTYTYSGTMPGSLTGTGWAVIVHPDNLDEAGRGWAGAVVSGQPYQVEFRLRRADGQWRWHIARAVPVLDAQGQVTRWVGTNTDIQDQKEIAAALEDLNATLEQRVQDRTAQLQKTEQALQQAQKMEAIGNLTGGIAHDFNNLLMAVSGSMELLKKRLPPDPALTRLIDNAMEGARRGASLTRRMLAFARRQPLQPERIDLGLLVDGMTELLQRALGPMVVVETRFPSGLPQVQTDPNQLESALLNLVVNARDAMNGEGRIIISAHAETLSGEGALLPGDYVCLSVSDTGEGMDADTLKRATEPFFTTKGVGKGTGLGLSMVHGLAEQSGGTLALHSKPGEGTRADIWLPAIAASDAVTERAAPAAAPQAMAHTPALKILAVDDDTLVLMNTTDMLEDLGHSVASAASGAEALALLDSGAVFDLVITDHAMPQMTGAQLAQEIARRRPGMPMLLATGYAELPADADIGLPQLSKPFTQAQLAEALARILQGVSADHRLERTGRQA